MKYNLLIFISFLIFIYFLKCSNSYLILPFKTYSSTIKNTEEGSIILLFKSLIENHIYINLEIGEPKQIIKAFLRMDTNDFYISQKPEKNTNNSYKINYDLDYFDYKNSNSLVITNLSINNIYGSGYASIDYLYISNNKNKTIKSKIPFILYNSTLLNISAVIGLEAILYEDNKKYNFIDTLKENDIIDSYFWMINYTTDYEGNLIIGEKPHIIDPLLFKEDNLEKSYPFMEDTMWGWGFIFDEIKFGTKNVKQYDCSFINYEINYIKGISELEKDLDIYFNESITNGICFKTFFNYLLGPKNFFYCNKDKYKAKIKNFPKLEFFHREFNYTFELNYKDLFIEKNDKLILLILFDDELFDWHLGKPFLRKYSFLMDQDTKILYFYKNKNNDNNKENIDKYNNDNNYILIKTIIIIILIIVLLIIGIFIGKYFINNAKRRKNTIDEDFDYTTKNEVIN